MTILPTQGRSIGERNAIKAWLKEHGAGDSQEIDTTKLAGTGIDGDKLIAQASRVAIDLVVLKGATQPGARSDLDEKQSIAAAKLALRNTTKLSESVTADLAGLTSAGVPDKAALTKLAAKADALRREAERFSQGERHLAWLTPKDQQELRSHGQALEAAYLAFAFHLAEAINLKGEAPGPSAARTLEQIRSDLLNVGSWANMLVPDETKLAAKQAAESQRLQALLGLSAAQVKEHFEASTDRWGGLSLQTSKPLDFNLGSRQLTEVMSDATWTSHRGNLDLSDNLIDSAWVLPDRLEGSASLASNALRDLGSFGFHPVEITGDLDLSNNKNLRSLEGLEQATVGGDVRLVGVPAQSLPTELNIGGKLIFDASQTSLIAEASYRQLAYQVVDQPGYKPFQLPADPAAALLDAAQTAPLTRDQLGAVVRATPNTKREELAAILAPRIQGSGLEAQEAFRAVGILDYKVKRLAAELALVPADPDQPLPKEIRELPTWKLLALSRIATSEDLRGHHHAAGFPEPSLTPRADRIIDVAVELARAGTSIGYADVMLPSWFQRNDKRLHRTTAQQWEILALDLKSVRLEKGELYLQLRSRAKEIPAALLFSGFSGGDAMFAAIESVAQRYPKHEPFLSTYRFLADNAQHRSSIGAGLAQALAQEEILALADPSPRLAAAIAKVDQLDRSTTASAAEAIAGAVTKGQKQLGEHPRGALFRAILRQDTAELSRGSDPRARSVMLNAAGLLFGSLSAEQRSVYAERLTFATVDQLNNQPTEAAVAEARFQGTLAALPPHQQAHLLYKFREALLLKSKHTFDRGVLGLIDALPDVAVAKALRGSGLRYALSDHRDALAAKLATFKLEGEVAEQLKPLLEQLKLNAQ